MDAAFLAWVDAHRALTQAELKLVRLELDGTSPPPEELHKTVRALKQRSDTLFSHACIVAAQQMGEPWIRVCPFRRQTEPELAGSVWPVSATLAGLNAHPMGREDKGPPADSPRQNEEGTASRPERKKSLSRKGRLSESPPACTHLLNCGALCARNNH